MSEWGFESLRQFEEQDGSVLLRRYVDHDKFRRLLTSRALCFSPASRFDDDVEGHYTQRDHRAWDDQLVRSNFDATGRALAAKAKASVARNNRKAVVISCWTRGVVEDLRMWREYGRGGDAVAVETTVERLRGALGPMFLLVPVTYIDYEDEAIPTAHSLQAYFFKRLKFAWEQELRAVGEMEIGKRLESPRMAPVHMDSVFQRIIVSPLARPGYREKVEELLAAESLSVPVQESAIRE